MSSSVDDEKTARESSRRGGKGTEKNGLFGIICVRECCMKVEMFVLLKHNWSS